MNGNIYKVNHGRKCFSVEEWKIFLAYKVIVVAGDYEVKRLKEMKFGDYFCLNHGNIIGGQGFQLIGKIIDVDAVECPVKSGWWQRNYEPIIKPIAGKEIYTGSSKKGWTPAGLGGHGEGTIFKVPENEKSDFEKEILIPHFGITLSQLF